MQALKDWFTDTLRLVFFLPLGENRPSGDWGAIFALLFASFALPQLLALWSVGLDGQWHWYSLPNVLVDMSLVLIASVACAVAVGHPEATARILMAGLMTLLALNSLDSLIASFDAFDFHSSRTGYQWVMPVWLALAIAVFAGRLGAPSLRRVGVTLISLALLAIPLGMTYRTSTLWFAKQDDTDYSALNARQNISSEDIFYVQPTLLAQELAGVRPGRKGVIDVFYVGMAGYGMQDVFRREVDAVDELLHERFGTEGRAVRLVNNAKTLADRPIASKTSLKAALKRIAENMDKDEDVLVLFLTSHGAQDHRFSLALWPMRFNDLTPAVLRTLLDESGIRHRVVIVSACYSGGFVKPLESPDTLVITASAPDRNSFGCTNQAEWTYFGKAYFDEALRSTPSFTKAFELAKPAVTERELKEKFEPSNPQMSAGSNIVEKLAQLEAQGKGGAIVATSGAGGRATGLAVDPYEAYVEARFTPEDLEDQVKLCAVGLEAFSPAAMLADRSDAFSGMEKSPKHWSRLVAAWSRYEKAFCKTIYEPAHYRALYLRKVKAIIPEAERDAALAFFGTPAGTRWLKLEHEVSRQQTLEFGRRQIDIGNTLYKGYLEEQAALFKEYMGGKP